MYVRRRPRRSSTDLLAPAGVILDRDPMTEASDRTTQDPVAYREWEISLIGEGDPAEVQAELPAQLRELLATGGDAATRRPAADAWSPLEVAAHLVDTEIIYSARYRYIVAHDQPPLVGYDPELLMARLHPHIDAENLPLLL